ncbi:MAG: hypothetical protein CEE40_03370 [Chloroflexi bacterium B3_Chlor]|nr:MAG: hypothetical protein CEE40_03370 [Chloroflexi bacterium B3_Chlor]
MAIRDVGMPALLVEQMQEAAEAVCRRFGYDDVLIALKGDDAAEPVCVVAAVSDRRQSFRQTGEKRRHSDAEGQLLEWIGSGGEAVLVGDISEEPDHVPIFPDARSELVVPIARAGDCLGTLAIGSVEPAAFDETTVVAVQTLADHLAVSIENARECERARADCEYFRTMVNGLQDQVMVIDVNDRIIDVNVAFLRQMKSTRDEVIGRPCYEVVYGRAERCDDTEAPCPLQEAWESGRASATFHTHYDQEGKGTHFRVSALPLRDQEGKVVRVIGACLDVTAEHRLEEKLGTIYALGRELVLSREAREIAGAVVRAAEQLLEFRVCHLWVIDEERRVLVCWACTPAGEMADISELSLDSERGICVIVARSGEAVYLPDSSQDPRYVSGRSATRSELCVALKVGDRVIGVLCAESEEVDAFGEDDRQVFSALADQAALAIENARLFESVMQQREQLRALALQLAEAEEAERQWLARELHDQVGQNLAALGINLNIIRSQLQDEVVGVVRAQVDDSLVLLEQTTERIRDLMIDLRPPVLDDYGLLAALRWYGEQWASRADVVVSVEGREPEPRLAPAAEAALFRIAQEALTNVAKHARAATVGLTVEVDGTTVRLIVADDGVGFDPTRLGKADVRRGLGLLTMTERAEAVGGQCHVESRPGSGTRVVVAVAR